MKERVGGHPHLSDVHSNFSGCHLGAAGTCHLRGVAMQNPNFLASSPMESAFVKGILYSLGGQGRPFSAHVPGPAERACGTQMLPSHLVDVNRRRNGH